MQNKYSESLKANEDSEESIFILCWDNIHCRILWVFCRTFCSDTLWMQHQISHWRQLQTHCNEQESMHRCSWRRPWHFEFKGDVVRISADSTNEFERICYEKEKHSFNESRIGCTPERLFAFTALQSWYLHVSSCCVCTVYSDRLFLTREGATIVLKMPTPRCFRSASVGLLPGRGCAVLCWKNKNRQHKSNNIDTEQKSEVQFFNTQVVEFGLTVRIWVIRPAEESSIFRGRLWQSEVDSLSCYLNDFEWSIVPSLQIALCMEMLLELLGRIELAACHIHEALREIVVGIPCPPAGFLGRHTESSVCASMDV